jgi:hypothetical protein
VTKQNTSRQLPGWSLAVLKSSSDLASSSIPDNLGRLRQTEQKAMERHALRVLSDKKLKRNEALRNGAVRLIVALLPKTFLVLEKLLGDFSSPLWYEVQFTIFCALDRGDLSKSDQRRVLTLVERYLMNVKSTAGYAAWKAGDLLGDEWNAPETVQILERLLFSAKHVSGRKSAIHGLKHAIEKATPPERDRLFSLIQEAASTDASAKIRARASSTLRGVGCHHLPYRPLPAAPQALCQRPTTKDRRPTS